MHRRGSSKLWLWESGTAAESVRTAVPHAGGITTMAARMHRRGNSKLWLRDTTTAAESVRTAQLHAGGETNMAKRMHLVRSKEWQLGSVWGLPRTPVILPMVAFGILSPVPLMLDTALVKNRIACSWVKSAEACIHVGCNWAGTVCTPKPRSECHLQREKAQCMKLPGCQFDGKRCMDKAREL